jgi:hypothetical protein
VLCLQCAIAIDGRNPLARFEAAGVLAALERHQEALAELAALQVRPNAVAVAAECRGVIRGGLLPVQHTIQELPALGMPHGQVFNPLLLPATKSAGGPGRAEGAAGKQAYCSTFLSSSG